MKKLVSTLTAILGISTLAAQDVVVKGPDEKLQLAVFVQNETKPCYSVSYNGKTMLEKSPLGMNTNIGDFTKNLKLTGHSVDKIDTVYQQTRIKVSNVHYPARINEHQMPSFARLLNCLFGAVRNQPRLFRQEGSVNIKKQSFVPITHHL